MWVIMSNLYYVKITIQSIVDYTLILHSYNTTSVQLHRGTNSWLRFEVDHFDFAYMGLLL